MIPITFELLHATHGNWASSGPAERNDSNAVSISALIMTYPPKSVRLSGN